MIRKPLIKSVDRNGNGNFNREILLRWQPGTYPKAEDLIESCGTIQLASAMLLDNIEETARFDALVEEMTKQHHQQMNAIKEMLEERISNLVVASGTPGVQVGDVISEVADIFSTLE